MYLKTESVAKFFHPTLSTIDREIGSTIEQSTIDHCDNFWVLC